MLVSGGSAQTVEGGLVVTLDPELLFGDPPETWSWTLRSSSNPAVTAADMQFTELDVNGTWQYTSPGVDVTTTLTLEVTGHRAGFPDAVATRVDTVLIWPGPWVWRTVGGALKFVAQFPG